MSKRLDVLTVTGTYEKDGEEKKRWMRVGVAFEGKDGNGWNIKLEAIPATRNDDGTIGLILREPKQRDGGGGDGGAF